LAEKHTLELFKREHFLPKISDRKDLASWAKAGAKDVREVARERAKQILKEHRPEPLDRTVREELLKIVKDVEKRELKNG